MPRSCHAAPMPCAAIPCHATPRPSRAMPCWAHARARHASHAHAPSAAQNGELSERCATLTANISSLFNTAKLELQRKDEAIKELRQRCAAMPCGCPFQPCHCCHAAPCQAPLAARCCIHAGQRMRATHTMRQHGTTHQAGVIQHRPFCGRCSCRTRQHASLQAHTLACRHALCYCKRLLKFCAHTVLPPSLAAGWRGQARPGAGPLHLARPHGPAVPQRQPSSSSSSSSSRPPRLPCGRAAWRESALVLPALRSSRVAGWIGSVLVLLARAWRGSDMAARAPRSGMAGSVRNRHAAGGGMRQGRRSGMSVVGRRQIAGGTAASAGMSGSGTAVSGGTSGGTAAAGAVRSGMSGTSGGMAAARARSREVSGIEPVAGGTRAQSGTAAAAAGIPASGGSMSGGSLSCSIVRTVP